jgi:hypothetical protein
MQLFKCQHCGQILYFENETCVRCEHRLGYMADASCLSALESQGDAWQALAAPGKRYRFCANAQFGACNWLVEASASNSYCAACSHNRTVPDLSVAANLTAWRKIEVAKHLLFYSLLKLRLPLGDAGEERLTFDFLASAATAGPRILTGHDNGLITLAIEEADDVERERRRTAMHEPYRTLLGHFRHEVGHYFWDRLVRDGGQLAKFRQIFDDDRIDYGEALQTYYAHGAPPDWPDRFISAYATSHPWEDFAETWAHYLHIIDTLEMAGAYNMNIHPKVGPDGALDAVADFNPYGEPDFGRIAATWIPLSNALNCLNRTMGLPDIYPFVLSPPVLGKLRAIHDLVRANSKASSQPAPHERRQVAS